MKRIQLGDGAGWFDLDRATLFAESNEWDADVGGFRSAATGKVGWHEMLARTATGTWAIGAWYSGTIEWNLEDAPWRSIETADAYAWLARNGHQRSIPVDEAGEFVERLAIAMFATRLPADLLETFREIAGRQQLTVQAATEQALTDWLTKVREADPLTA